MLLVVLEYHLVETPAQAGEVTWFVQGHILSL